MHSVLLDVFCVSWYASKIGGHIWSLEKRVMEPEEYRVFETVLFVFFTLSNHNTQCARDDVY